MQRIHFDLAEKRRLRCVRFAENSMTRFLKQFLFSISLTLLVPAATWADIVKLEAESATLGSDYIATNDSSGTYIILASTSVGEAPSNAVRVATFAVTFPS